MFMLSLYWDVITVGLFALSEYLKAVILDLLLEANSQFMHLPTVTNLSEINNWHLLKLCLGKVQLALNYSLINSSAKCNWYFPFYIKQGFWHLMMN